MSIMGIVTNPNKASGPTFTVPYTFDTQDCPQAKPLFDL